MNAPRLLATYLNDHLAGSVGALELARRSAGSNRGSDYGETLAELADEIAEDHDSLQEIMRRLDAGVDHAKVALAWSAEKLGRLKPNGMLIGYSPLSRLEELELLSLGIEGKLMLWESLQPLVRDDDRLEGIDIGLLIERARSQRARLEGHRSDVVADALLTQ